MSNLFEDSSSGGEAAFLEERDWLKSGPQTNNDASDSNEDNGSDVDDDNDDDDNDDLLPVEREALRLKKKQKKLDEEQQEEMQLNIEQREKFQLPGDEEEEEGEGEEGGHKQLHEGSKSPALKEVQMRIQEVLRVLGNFVEERQEHRTRKDYIQLLRQDLAHYYGTNDFLIKQTLRLFSPSEAVEFLEASEAPRPVTVRANTLKVRRRDLAQALISRGVNLDPVGDWSKVGLQIFESTVPIGATPEYLAGYYMLQGAASLLPVMALGAAPGERVLDMCAAPGGKTTHIAQDMRNQGVLFANDVNKERCSALVANIHRMGVTNAIISNVDALKFPELAGGFDRVLLDAPCSGLGVMSRDPRVKTNKSISDIHMCRNLQKKLILHAIDSLKPKGSGPGVLIYCTCTLSVEENEEIVQYALDNRDVEVVDSELPFGVEGFVKFETQRFHPSMKFCRRIYPHVHNMDGFFVAKLIKKSSNITQEVAQSHKAEKDREKDQVRRKKQKDRLRKVRKAAKNVAKEQKVGKKGKKNDNDE